MIKPVSQEAHCSGKERLQNNAWPKTTRRFLCDFFLYSFRSLQGTFGKTLQKTFSSNSHLPLRV
jgi:hypothetical protein